METTVSKIQTIRVVPGFQSLLLNSGKAFGMIRAAQSRLARTLGADGRRYFAPKRIPRGAWAEKNDVSFRATEPAESIPCKPLRAWAMILQENKIRK
jgi:hypothetical protein